MVNRLRVYVISSLRAYPSRNEPDHKYLQYFEVVETWNISKHGDIIKKSLLETHFIKMIVKKYTPEITWRIIRKSLIITLENHETNSIISLVEYLYINMLIYLYIERETERETGRDSVFHLRLVFKSSQRKLAWVEFEPTTTDLPGCEFSSHSELSVFCCFLEFTAVHFGELKPNFKSYSKKEVIFSYFQICQMCTVIYANLLASSVKYAHILKLEIQILKMKSIKWST